MLLTPIGILIIIATVFFLARRKNLVILAIIVSPLQAASVVNFNNVVIGISPYYFILVFIFIQFLVKISTDFKRGKYGIQKYSTLIVRNYFFCLNIFLAWGALSLFSPFLFEGIKVYIPRMGIEDQLGNLSFSFSNIAQLIYLALNIVFVKQIYQFSKTNGTKPFNKIIYAIGIFSILVGLWDFSRFGFPRQFFANNIISTLEATKNYVIIDRVASTFSEPSMLGAFLGPLSIFFLSLLISKTKKIATNIILSISSICVLFLTFSTTAYISFFLGLILLFLCVFPQIKTSKVLIQDKPKKCYKETIKIIVFILLVSILLSVLIFNLDKFIVNALNDVLFEKNKSLSAEYRNNSNTYSYKIFLETFGIGVGLGSNRPSSLTAYLISNLGVIGLLYYLGNIILISAYFFSNVCLKKNLESQQFFLLWIVNFIAMSFSVPDLNWPFFWIYTGFILSSMNHKYIKMREI
jgi:hypothetical protein